MAVIVHVQSSEWTQQHYDRILGEVMPGGRLIPGCLSHVAGPRPDGGWQVIDVWESPEAFQQFAQQTLIPAAQRLGLPQINAPQIAEVHNFVKG